MDFLPIPITLCLSWSREDGQDSSISYGTCRHVPNFPCHRYLTLLSETQPVPDCPHPTPRTKISSHSKTNQNNGPPNTLLQTRYLITELEHPQYTPSMGDAVQIRPSDVSYEILSSGEVIFSHPRLKAFGHTRIFNVLNESPHITRRTTNTTITTTRKLASSKSDPWFKMFLISPFRRRRKGTRKPLGPTRTYISMRYLGAGILHVPADFGTGSRKISQDTRWCPPRDIVSDTMK